MSWGKSSLGYSRLQVRVCSWQEEMPYIVPWTSSYLLSLTVGTAPSKTSLCLCSEEKRSWMSQAGVERPSRSELPFACCKIPAQEPGKEENGALCIQQILLTAARQWGWNDCAKSWSFMIMEAEFSPKQASIRRKTQGTRESVWKYGLGIKKKRKKALSS